MKPTMPLRPALGPSDQEGRGRERYHEQTEEQRRQALRAMVEDSGLDLSRHEPRHWPALSELRAFARGWLAEHQRNR